jgi:hypothetical protein
MDPMKQLTAFDAGKKAYSLFEEFKKFAFKGNVVDLAIGVIIGAAFGAIVKSLVEDIIMPLIGLILPGDKGYEGWVWQVGDKIIPYGKFLAAASGLGNCPQAAFEVQLERTAQGSGTVQGQGVRLLGETGLRRCFGMVLYSIVHHEMGHALFFNPAYPRVAEAKRQGKL